MSALSLASTGSNVFLLRQRVAFVDLAVEMYCQVWYCQERTVDFHCNDFGPQGVGVVAQYHPAGIDSGRSNQV